MRRRRAQYAVPGCPDVCDLNLREFVYLTICNSKFIIKQVGRCLYKNYCEFGRLLYSNDDVRLYHLVCKLGGAFITVSVKLGDTCVAVN
jgi:hypothetical protein